MLPEDLETLISSKKIEIEKEKVVLGISPAIEKPIVLKNAETQSEQKPMVKFQDQPNNDNIEQLDKQSYLKTLYELQETIPAELERYIRRYCGLPVMLKAGEYSPNNPLVRTERAAGDALMGLGEYERRRHTLRRIRQAQYRQHLDQQAKKKQEAKEQAEREKREREEKEREREERQRQILLERESGEERRASVCHGPVGHTTSKVDTGVQVSVLTTPLSVAVQTDDAELYRLSPSPHTLTEAERELSPREVDSRPLWAHQWDYRRKSCGHDDVAVSGRGRDVGRLPSRVSVFDADVIQLRNIQAEKEAAARRQYYQQELKNQIMEQQRIREERKNRERMLEQAEMRRLEEQLRMLRVAQENEIDKQHDIHIAMKENASDFEMKRTELQRDIDTEQKKLRPPASSIPPNNTPIPRHNVTSQSDTKLPHFHQKNEHIQTTQKKPYSFNISDNSLFSDNYDVDSYLRKNLNFRDKIDNKKNVENEDLDISIPVLRHSPKAVKQINSNKLSDAMKKIDDKWKVPAVQKNILKCIPSGDGRNISILTQLGSIRRQLQLEQLKLDKLLAKDS